MTTRKPRIAVLALGGTMQGQVVKQPLRIRPGRGLRGESGMGVSELSAILNG